MEDVANVLSEIRRVLKPGGQFLFLEHVAGPEGSRTRLTQTIFNPCKLRSTFLLREEGFCVVQQLIADGCHLTRDTLSSIKATGFRSIDAKSINIEKAAFLAPHIVGVATV